jgi:uncharacterized delta-60 repeat protein
VRLSPGGARDATFGSNGAVTVNDSYELPTVLPDGSIVVTRVRNPTTIDAHELVRFTSKGKLDSIFGGDGVAADQPSVPFRSINRVLAQPDGKLLVAGHVFARFGNFTRRAFALGRLNSDGTWDTGFGDFGRALTPISTRDSEIHDIALASDGRILAVGNSSVSSSKKIFAAVRYNADGTVDKTYGTDGIATIPFIDERPGYSSPQVSTALGVFLDDLSRAVLAGSMDSTFALARLDATGKLDDGFGRITDARDSIPKAMQLSAGRLLFAGSASSRKGKYSVATSAFDLNSTAPASPISLEGSTLSIAGTAASDVVFIRSDADNILARINGYGRIFSRAAVTLVSMSLGAGNDVVDATTSSAAITVSAGDGDDRMVGGDLDDSLTGGAGKDRMDGGKGNDRLAGNGGRDKIAGAEGNDRIFGGASGDFLAGQGGHDEIWGEGGLDRINGSFGADTVHAGAGDDVILNGRDGDKDFIFGDSGNDWCVDKGQFDELVSIEKITST